MSFDTYKKRLDASRPPFERMVDDDIKKCDEYLSGDRDETEGMELHFELITKYPAHLVRFGDSLYNYSDEFGFCAQESFGVSAMVSNLTAIRNKLVGFKGNGYKNSSFSKNDSSINIENRLTATQTVNITFEEVKQQIEDMTGLSDEETKEALSKIDEIKVVVESQEPKKTKWQKVKPILAWLADKSVDVGIAILPLLLKIGG